MRDEWECKGNAKTPGSAIGKRGLASAVECMPQQRMTRANGRQASTQDSLRGGDSDGVGGIGRVKRRGLEGEPQDYQLAKASSGFHESRIMGQ